MGSLHLTDPPLKNAAKAFAQADRMLDVARNGPLSSEGSSARQANLLLARNGNPYETYDHLIRTSDQLNRAIRYIERNPVRAGLATRIEDWPWSSAGAGQRPTPQGFDAA